jgi:hypothetical protein
MPCPCKRLSRTSTGLGVVEATLFCTRKMSVNSTRPLRNRDLVPLPGVRSSTFCARMITGAVVSAAHAFVVEVSTTSGPPTVRRARQVPEMSSLRATSGPTPSAGVFEGIIIRPLFGSVTTKLTHQLFDWTAAES